MNAGNSGTLTRWWKFNLVGAVGVVVQLAALAGFKRLLGSHYLLASALAVEITLLHNFAWHVRYTWSDRCQSSDVLPQLVRFHLSNGTVSLLGNILLMRALVGWAHQPLLLADGLAIVCCSIANFYLGHRWAFAVSAVPERSPQPKPRFSDAPAMKQRRT